MEDSARQHSHAMAIPHRRPAFGVNAPALFRHIGFRIQDPQDNPLTATEYLEADARRAKFISGLNRSLARIQELCDVTKPVAFSDSRDELTEDAIPITNTLLINLHRLPEQRRGWRWRMLVDIHSEYYFITFIFDQPSARDTVAEIGNIERDLSSKGCGAVDIKAFIANFYEKIWDELENHLEGSLAAMPGDPFTEFRAIALRDTESPLVKNRHEHQDKFTIPEIDSADFKKARQSLRDWLTRNAPCIHQILQFEEFTKNVDQDANCILCEVLDGAGIYGSSVRQAVPAKSPPVRSGDSAKMRASGGIQPLRYFLLYNGLSKYQLGRLVRRTHIMGELRVAAVLDAPLLHDASSRIRSLGNRIDTLLTDKDEAATLADDELDSVLQELNKINSLVPGGLMYRVNRSRYYVNAFHERMPDMRVQRLEGWQPYNEFFRRNLYQVFKEIDQIGSRYESLAQRVNRLTIARNAERSRLSQENIRSLVREMTAADRTIARIQELGEWVGFVAVTYYGGHIVDDILRAICGREYPVTGYIVAGAFAFGVGYFWHRSQAIERENNQRFGNSS